MVRQKFANLFLFHSLCPFWVLFDKERLTCRKENYSVKEYLTIFFTTTLLSKSCNQDLFSLIRMRQSFVKFSIASYFTSFVELNQPDVKTTSRSVRIKLELKKEEKRERVIERFHSLWSMESISPTFCVQLFCTKVSPATFLYLNWGLNFFWARISAQKLLKKCWSYRLMDLLTQQSLNCKKKLLKLSKFFSDKKIWTF